ncbi:MAG: hypothetical protein ABL957_14410 [Parvularculaceae bacterium]
MARQVTSLAVFIFSAFGVMAGSPVEAAQSGTASAGPSFDLSLFEETGEEKTCLYRNKILRIFPVDKIGFVFQTKDGLWLNRTQSECIGSTDSKTRIEIHPSGPICKGHGAYLFEGTLQAPHTKCTLGKFMKLKGKDAATN